MHGWPQHVRHALRDAWVVRDLPDTLRVVSFQLPLMLSIRTRQGVRWAIEEEEEVVGDAEKRGTFARLWISLASNELKMRLDDIEEMLSESIEQDETTDGKGSSRPHASIVVILLRTQELIVDALCANDDVAANVSSSCLLGLLKTLRQCAEMLMGFVNVALDISARTQRHDTWLNEILEYSLRIIGRYALEDIDEGIQKQFADLVVKLCAAEDDNTCDQEPLQYLLPALNGIFSSDEDASSRLSSHVSASLFRRTLHMIVSLPIGPATAAAHVASSIARRVGSSTRSLSTSWLRDDVQRRLAVRLNTAKDGEWADAVAGLRRVMG